MPIRIDELFVIMAFYVYDTIIMDIVSFNIRMLIWLFWLDNSCIFIFPCDWFGIRHKISLSVNVHLFGCKDNQESVTWSFNLDIFSIFHVFWLQELLNMRINSCYVVTLITKFHAQMIQNCLCIFLSFKRSSLPVVILITDIHKKRKKHLSNWEWDRIIQLMTQLTSFSDGYCPD